MSAAWVVTSAAARAIDRQPFMTVISSWSSGSAALRWACGLWWTRSPIVEADRLVLLDHLDLGTLEHELDGAQGAG